MRINFLEAEVPIRKAYEKDPKTGALIKHPYPFVYDVSSYEHEVSSLDTFEGLIRAHAGAGHTLLKGVLGRPLVRESRAGATSRETPTQWICLDLDGIEGYQSTDQFLDSIGLGEVSYIRQWSSSQGVESQTGFRCHLFLLLDRPIHPALLKQWLMHVNLATSQIAGQLELTKTGNSLRWPLDISTCQNDKLLYIASPEFKAPLSDPFSTGNRIELVKRARDTATFPSSVPTPDSLRQAVHRVVNTLREKQGLEKRRKSTFKYDGPIEYFANPDRAVITEIREEREFVYFNLNGGDSWGYYHPANNPKFIFNFKGEPTYRTQDLLPDYWATIEPVNGNFQASASGRIMLAFRDFRSSNYFNGHFDPNTGKLELAQAKTKTQLEDFMKQNNIPIKDYIPDWNITFDPHKPYVVDEQNRLLNIFEPSDIMKEPPNGATAVPPTIRKILTHVLGNDVPTYDHFINWLSVAVQGLDRTGTAWILHGTQGTGKGVLFHNILTPLFGEHNVASKRMEELESEFTGFMENKFLVFIDEVETGKSFYKDRVAAKLKNLITEPRVSVRKMYQPAFETRNYANMVFASNKDAPVEIAPDDRRFNVGGYQPLKISLTTREIDTDIPAELPNFYGYLMGYPANAAVARVPLASAARSRVIDISTSAVDVVSARLLAGDIDYFWDQLKATKPLNTHVQLLTKEGAAYEAYRQLVIEIVQTAPKSLSREELHVLFEWTVGNVPDRPNKLTSYLKHHKIHMKNVSRHGRTVRGIDVIWQQSPNQQNMLNEINNGTV